MIRTGARLDAIDYVHQGGLRFRHGGDGGSEQAMTLRPAEHIVEVQLTRAKKNGTYRVSWIRIETSGGRVLEGGKQSGAVTKLRAPTGKHIVGFHGRSGADIDRLGVLYATL